MKQKPQSRLLIVLYALARRFLTMESSAIVNDKLKKQIEHHHSYLSATNGSTFVARRAGMKHASNATTINTKVTATNVGLSVGSVPKSKFVISRVSKNDAPRPRPTPANTRTRPCVINTLSTSRR